MSFPYPVTVPVKGWVMRWGRALIVAGLSVVVAGCRAGADRTPQDAPGVPDEAPDAQANGDDPLCPECTEEPDGWPPLETGGGETPDAMVLDDIGSPPDPGREEEPGPATDPGPADVAPGLDVPLTPPARCPIFDGACDDAIPPEPWWYFDGAGCAMQDSCVCPACPGTFVTPEECQACIGNQDCRYLAALADSPYGFEAGDYEQLSCPALYPMAQPCSTDADCPVGALLYGGRCVLGNCVYCWQDIQCGTNEVCRAGRCVPRQTTCFPPPPCTGPGCLLVTPSEAPCPVCVCESWFNRACSEDDYCMFFSVHPFRRCVYGRCAECRNDDDCGGVFSGRCLPPGMCYSMTPGPHVLFGTWLIGWPGGLDHFSYFRFEPDGTLRRARYLASGVWADDFPALPCWPETFPLLGTWEPQVTASGFLVVRASLNLPCDPGAGWTGRFLINLHDGGHLATFYDIDSDRDLMGSKVSPDTCVPDFSSCRVPVWVP